MTNKGNIATAWHTPSVIRSSAGDVFSAHVFMPFYHAESNSLSMTYISKDYTSVKYAKAEGEKISQAKQCSCPQSLHAGNLSTIYLI